MKPHLGVDVGGVISDSRGAGDTMFSKNYLESPFVPDAVASLAMLVEHFNGNVSLVSKCGENIERKTKEWLTHHAFDVITGIGKDRWFFVRTRAAKAPTCDFLRITHFIDDRLEVLSYLESVPNRILFRPNEDEIAKQSNPLPHVRVESWRDVRRHFGLKDPDHA